MPKTRAHRRASTPTNDDGDNVVIYIHGIGRHLPKDALKLEWDLALFGKDRGGATKMAYWSDIVHPATAARRTAAATGPDDLGTDAILRQAGVDPRNAKAREFVERVRRAYGFQETAGGGPRKKILPLPGFLREPISRAFLKQFIADTAAYFFDDDKRARVRRRLSEILPVGESSITIVAHSQGSIAAVEVLAQLPKITVTKLVTIGSPLGLQEVQDFLDVEPRKKPFYAPACIERWDNFADPLDPVALDKGLAAEFVTAPVTHASILLATPITDQLIVNDRTFRLRGFNPHSAAGYLSHPKVRRSVYESTNFDAMARFVVARDVAEALAIDERHPVLIEVLEPGYPAVDETTNQLAAREKAEQQRAPLSLAKRIDRAAMDLRALVRSMAVEAGMSAQQAEKRVETARVDVLRRFVAAHLNPDEIRRVADDHRNFNVYAVWRSASKKRLLHRSRRVLQADAALESYRAAGAHIKWAVLDTGIRSDHPHFAGRIVAIWDCTKTGAPKLLESDQDRDGHGSHVAGIVAGTSGDAERTYLGGGSRGAARDL